MQKLDYKIIDKGKRKSITNSCLRSPRNSKGFRLSKTVVEKYNIKDKVEIILEKGYIILKPISTPRKDWEQAFKEMSENGDDQLLFNDVFENENLEEWS